MNKDINQEQRIYHADRCCVFRKTKEEYGGLSNMASGFPLIVNNIPILTSEALYQACRFPYLPEVQEEIISQKSPMTAKMVSKPFRNQSRDDWDNVRIKIMRWSIKVKLAQNYFTLGKVLESTFDKPIVEDSRKDNFWGAIRTKEDNNILAGVNALGRLLMELRLSYYENKTSYEVFVIEPPDIPDFLLFGKPIETIDERLNFLNIIKRNLKFEDIEEMKYKPSEKEIEIIDKYPEMVLESDKEIEIVKKIVKAKTTRKTKKRKKSEPDNDSQQNIFENS